MSKNDNDKFGKPGQTGQSGSGGHTGPSRQAAPHEIGSNAPVNSAASTPCCAADFASSSNLSITSASPAEAKKWGPYLYPCRSVIRHVTSGQFYVIALVPNLLRIESTSLPAYGYRAVASDGGIDGPLWVLSQAEMEDGRFELADATEETEVSPVAPAPRSNYSMEFLKLGKLVVPDFGELLKLSRSRYEATYVSYLGEQPASWDCTGFLCANYALADFWAVLQDKTGSFLADSLREDENAPEWVRDAEEGAGIVTVRSVS